MSLFVPCNSEAHADAMSEALWNLARPPAVRSPGEVTRFYAPRVEDANGAWWMEIPDGFDLDVSSLADAALFDVAIAQIELAEDAP